MTGSPAPRPPVPDPAGELRHAAKFCPYCREGRACPYLMAAAWRRTTEQIRRRVASECDWCLRPAGKMRRG